MPPAICPDFVVALHIADPLLTVAGASLSRISAPMDAPKRQLGFRGRSNGIWLRKRICERAGLIVSKRSNRHLQFGWRAYFVEIPDHLPSGRAVRLALRLRRHRRLLRLGHVANRLLAHAARNPFWSKHTHARLKKPVPTRHDPEIAKSRKMW